MKKVPALRTRSEDLEILLMVVDTGGFSSAAESLNIQTAKVSRAVSRIEKNLGVTILNRTTRRINVTEEGRRFINSIRSGIEQVNRAEEDIVSGQGRPSGKLRLDAASPFIFHQLVPHISSFSKEFPDIDLELTSNEGIVDLLEKKIDLAIRIGKMSDSTLYAKFLGSSELYIVVSPKYIEQFGCPSKVNDIFSHRTIGFTNPKSLNNWPLRGVDTIAPNLSSSNGETIRQLALEGNGIACLSGFMIKKDIDEGRLISLFEDEKLSNTGREQIHAVYYKSSSVAKRISVFIDFIRPRLCL